MNSNKFLIKNRQIKKGINSKKNPSQPYLL